MNIKRLIAGLCFASLASAAGQALAENHHGVVTLHADADGWLTADLSMTHSVAGAFVDTFTFEGLGGAALVNAYWSTQATNAYADINLTSVTLNGVAFDPRRLAFSGYANGTERAYLDDTAFDSMLTLVITGVAGGNLAAGTAIAASYASTINAIPSAVPEPKSLALMLAGLMAVGFVAGRRRA